MSQRRRILNRDKSSWTTFLDAPLEIIDGDRGKQYPKRSDLLEHGHCLFLNASNVTKDGFRFEQCQFISQDRDAMLRNGRLVREDVILTTRGTLGNVAYFNSRVCMETMRINSGMVIIRSDPSKISPSFLYNFVRSVAFANQVEQLRSGAAQPQLPIRDINKIKLPIPPLHVQHRIADILSAYDDLIENNNRRMALLEESIHLLYREWFVYLRFPGHERTKIVDGVPQGWRRLPLGECCDVVMGQSPRSDFYNKEGTGLPFHQGVADFGRRFVSHTTWCTEKNRLAKPGDILCSVRAPVGRLNLTEEEIVIGRGLCALRNRAGYQSFQFHQLKAHFHEEDLIGNGSIFASVTKKVLLGQPMLVPPPPLVDDFQRHSISHDEQYLKFHRTNKKLREARDLLLPRLMDGRIPV